MALGARFVDRISEPADGDGALLMLSSDHAIEPQEAFVSDVRAAMRLAGRGWLTTFGIEPTRLETGYGYLELGDALGDGYRVAAFREKPDHQTATRFLAAGGFLWNAGMFLFPRALLRSELQLHAPAIATAMAGPPFRFPRHAPPPPSCRHPPSCARRTAPSSQSPSTTP